MIIEPGNSGNFELKTGKTNKFNHNKPVTYRIVTEKGSLIEVNLPAGGDIAVTSAGDIRNIDVMIHDSLTGPQEIV